MEPHGHTITSYLGKTPLVIDLSKMDPWSKIAYSHAVIAYLYNHLKRKGITSKPRVMILVDEAHNLFPRHTNQWIQLVEEAFVEARKYGLRLVLATAYPQRLSQTIIYNTTTLIAHKHTNQIDAEETAKQIAQTKQETQTYTKLLQNLETGQTIIKHKTITNLVKIKDTKTNKNKQKT